MSPGQPKTHQSIRLALAESLNQPYSSQNCLARSKIILIFPSPLLFTSIQPLRPSHSCLFIQCLFKTQALSQSSYLHFSVEILNDHHHRRRCKATTKPTNWHGSPGDPATHQNAANHRSMMLPSTAIVMQSAHPKKVVLCEPCWRSSADNVPSELMTRGGNPNLTPTSCRPSIKQLLYCFTNLPAPPRSNMIVIYHLVSTITSPKSAAAPHCRSLSTSTPSGMTPRRASQRTLHHKPSSKSCAFLSSSLTITY